MSYSVPVLSMISMTVAALAGLAIPSILFLVLRKKYKTSINLIP